MTPFSAVGININSTLNKNVELNLILFYDKSGSLGWHQTNVMLNINYGFILDKTKLRIGADYDFRKKNVEESIIKTKIIIPDNPNLDIVHSSYTDNKGSEEYNQKLSEERAHSCVNYLIELGISKARLKAKGYGESAPIAPNENEDGFDNLAGREKNRRTEFKVISF
jgi:outer membrane protein OmpA-like peptidoglycan-associated protein